MLKKYFLSILFLFCLTKLFASENTASDTLYYVGNIKVAKNISYKYIMRFVIAADNSIAGYSLTDPGGMYETKMKITGTFDSLKWTLAYEEKSVLRTRADINNGEMCYIKATLNFGGNKYAETLAGKFTGIGSGKTEPCAEGEIKLLNTERAKRIMADLEEKDKKKEEKRKEKAKEKAEKNQDN
jgi:hypothetical protein